MERAAKVNWNDHRMDHFAEQVDRRFEHVDERFDKFEAHVDTRFNRLEDRFDALQHSMIYSLAGILAAFAAVVVTANF